jgi:DNA-binding NarL/FixJ family response regulator/signal transduction histidine kinase
MLPLAWLILGASLLLILTLPLLLRTAIIKPLNALLAGVHQMDAGNLNVEIPVQSQDDTGFLTQAFNRMAARLNTQMITLETRVTERTLELAAANELLRAEMGSREETQAQVLEQQRTLAILDERVRLSRQLHDGLGQVMGYINVQTQAAQAFLSKGQNEAAFNSLDRVAHLAQEAHADIRNFILSLRTSSPGALPSLLASLEEFTREFSRDSGIQTSLSMPGETPLPALTPAVEEQILRIIQEALTNVRKHSSAKKAEIWFSFDDRSMQIVVSDDGVGFDVRTLVGSEHHHFGLGMMRERAEVVGGRLEVRSVPGQGTKILIFIPHFPLGGTGRSRNEVEGILGLRLLLVDDSPIFLEGLRNLLMARGLTVIGTAHDGLEAQEKARELRPDVIVMDVMMPRCNGLEATRLIKAEFPEIKIVMLTVSEEDNHLFDAIQNGASGFLLKGMDANEFCTLLARLTHGESPMTPGAASRLMSEFSQSRSRPPTRAEDEVITERQWQILDMVARGLTYRETGLALHLSEKTIKYHMGEILKRLHLKNRTQAIAYARRLQER